MRHISTNLFLPLIVLSVVSFSPVLFTEDPSSPTVSEPLPLLSMEEIGMKVWKNESRATLEGLIFWNPKEEFLSLGIGHFIWYPANKEGPFDATFPSLLAFLKQEGVTLPSWLHPETPCPWKNRAHFLKKRHHKKVVELRALLASTIGLQARFLYQRFQESKQKLQPFLSPTEKELLTKLEEIPQGLYALIDYLNFKGTGLSLTEKYKGMGWGLLQVLQGMDPSRQDLVKEFTRSAKTILERRVHNSPSERKESLWLKGWHKRLETYLETT